MTRQTIETIAFFVALLLVCLALHAWIASRDEQQRLQSTLTTQKKLLDAADTRESTRNATLADALAQINALKNSKQSPEQIARDLPKYISLPQPITLVDSASRNAPQAKAAAPPKDLKSNPQQGTDLSAETGSGGKEISPSSPQSSTSDATSSTAQNSLPDAPLPPAPECQTSSAECSAELPPADLKPLYDYVQDCRACQAELAIAKQNSADDATKIAALTSERDAAIAASKGGTFWRRLRSDALWFAIGAAAGATAHLAAAH